MRLSEALQIIPEDIDFKAKPVTIHLRDTYTKTRARRDVFLSDEAVAVLKEWISEREDYLNSKGHYAKNLKRAVKPDDPRVFPITREAVERLFNAALIKSGYCQEERGKKGERIPIKDVETGRSPIHIHGLRKTFRRELARAENPRAVDVTEFLMGHEGTYSKPDEEEARAFYLENMHRVMIRPGTTPKDRETMKALAEVNAQLRERLAAVEATITPKDKEAQESDLYKKILSQVKKDLGIKT